MSVKSVTIALLWTIAGYFLGGIMFCSWLPRRLTGKDICEISSDHNPGATNVFIHCGAPLGLACLLLDLLKGFIPVYFASRSEIAGTVLMALVIAAPALGHATGVFNHFRGGKCIATIFGEVLGLLPISYIGILLAVLYILFSMVLCIRPDRKCSILTFSVFGSAAFIIEWILGRFPVGLGCLLISLISIGKHLIAREEPEEEKETRQEKETVPAGK